VASSRAATANATLCGDRPRSQDRHERAYLRFGRTFAIVSREGHSDYFGPCYHTSFESLRTPRAPAGGKPREQANPFYGRQEVRERSLYDRYPRSLAALETTRAPGQS
jgi:hypothetical protein